MGLLDRFRPKPARKVVVAEPARRKRGRPTKAEAAERRKMQLAEMKTRLDLKKYERELEALDGQWGGKPYSLEDVVSLNRQLRPLGLHIAPINGEGFGEGGGLAGWVKALADSQLGAAIGGSLPALAAGMLTPTAAAPPAQSLQLPPAAAASPTPPVEPPAQPVSGEPAGQSASAPAAPAASPATVSPERAEQLRGVVRRMSALPPTSVADFLSKDKSEPNATWVAILTTTPAENLWPTLEAVAAEGGEAAILVGALTDHRAWAEQVAAELRQRAGQTAGPTPAI